MPGSRLRQPIVELAVHQLRDFCLSYSPYHFVLLVPKNGRNCSAIASRALKILGPDRSDRAIHRFAMSSCSCLDLAHLDRGAKLLRQLLDRLNSPSPPISFDSQHALRRVDVAQLLALVKPFRLFGLYLGRVGARRPIAMR